MKRALLILAVALANIAVLAHSSIPHHKHIDSIYIEIASDGADHKSHHHDDAGCLADEGCLMEATIQEDTQVNHDKGLHLGHDYQHCAGCLIQKDISHNPCIYPTDYYRYPILHEGVLPDPYSPGTGLRAPPVC